MCVSLDQKFLTYSFVLSTGAPHGFVLSPLRFTLYTHDCIPRPQENFNVKYADDTTIIINND